MYLALMNSELHIRFVLHFSLEYKHLVFIIISDPIFMYDVAQSNNICDSSLAKPNIFVVTRHFFLVIPYNCFTVALKLHAVSGLECL